MTAPSAIGDPMPLPEGWEVIQSLVGMLWPNGDEEMLKSAGNAWRDAGAGIDQARAQSERGIGLLSGQRSPELYVIEGALEEFRGQLSELASACNELGDSCTEYANELQTSHEQVRNELVMLLATEVAIAGVSLAASILTVGISAFVGAAAGAAQLSATAARVASIIRIVVSAASRVGTRISGVASRVSSVTARIGNLRVIRAVSYAGNKAPRWVRITAGQSVEMATNVGIDFILGGGQITNLGATLLGGIRAPGFRPRPPVPGGSGGPPSVRPPRPSNPNGVVPQVPRLGPPNTNGLRYPDPMPGVGTKVGVGEVVPRGRPRNPHIDYQLRVTGHTRTPDGKVPEYRVNGVDFDGFAYTGQPPTPTRPPRRQKRLRLPPKPQLEPQSSRKHYRVREETISSRTPSWRLGHVDCVDQGRRGRFKEVVLEGERADQCCFSTIIEILFLHNSTFYFQEEHCPNGSRFILSFR